MIFGILAELINILANLLILLIIVYVILSWLVPPYQPLRENVDRIVEPMLAPIRRVVPLLGMIDLSPLILLVLIELISRVLTNLLLSL